MISIVRVMSNFSFFLFFLPGLGDMAVSNSIGSNVFDILVGLGLPWALQTLAIDYGSTVSCSLLVLLYTDSIIKCEILYKVLPAKFICLLGKHL